MIRICAITERRADYSKLRPVLRKLVETPGFELSLIVAGHHLLPEMGNTVELIEQEGFAIAARVPMFSYRGEDNGAEMAKAMGKALIGMTEALEKQKIDLLLVGFDLGAHLAGAMAAAHMNIPVAHLEGGLVTGSIDEPIRHSISRFAHIHFAETEASAQRLVRMGENPRYVFNVGCPSLDTILSADFPPPHETGKKFNLDLSKRFILVMQHPVTTEAEDATEQILRTLSAVKRTGMQAILIYPNIDAGGKRIIQAIENTPIQSYKNLPFELYIGLLNVTGVIVGNSSSGIVEAPSFKLPAVNIGTRQQGREKTSNVIDVGYDEEEIYQAIQKAMYDKKFREGLEECRNPYGDGKASQRIIDILSSIDLKDPRLIQKRLMY